MRRLLTMAALTGLLLVVFSAGGSAATQGATLAPSQAAQKLLDSPAVLTPQARTALLVLAKDDRALSHEIGVPADAAQPSATPEQAGAEAEQSRLRNVRVNDPGEDVHQTDQTTQSETTIAAAGRNVVVGFNDSQTSLLTLTAGTDLNGYSYSQDGGASFKDGGVIPNRAGCVNFGDPWLASDRAGGIYYSSLVQCQAPSSFGVFIGVAKSTDGGRTFAPPVILPTPTAEPFYQADKDSLTAGPDPAVKSRDNLYDAWDDFTFAPTGSLAGLAVARSTDGGQHWQTAYAAQIPASAPCPGGLGVSFTQFIGAAPIVDPSSGKLYVAAEKLHQPCPTAPGPPPPMQPSEVIYASTNGGQSFGPEVKISDLTPSFPGGVLSLGPGRLMRNIEFPTLAFFGGNLFAAWNDGRSGHSHVLLSGSSNGGTTWSPPLEVTTGQRDQMQPAMSGDSSGLHILHYQRNLNNRLDVRVANSTDGRTFHTRRVTNVSFPGVFTLPQFDPLIAPTYMGDYIANVSTGASQLFAWGDNRDIVTDFLFPAGRNDPDVFFADEGAGDQ